MTTLSVVRSLSISVRTAFPVGHPAEHCEYSILSILLMSTKGHYICKRDRRHMEWRAWRKAENPNGNWK